MKKQTKIIGGGIIVAALAAIAYRSTRTAQNDPNIAAAGSSVDAQAVKDNEIFKDTPFIQDKSLEVMLREKNGLTTSRRSVGTTSSGTDITRGSGLITNPYDLTQRASQNAPEDPEPTRNERTWLRRFINWLS